jgi:guanylate kinase
MSNKACCLLFIVSAPSGTGKTTVVERLVRVTDRLKLSRSYTSRAPRGDEADGVDYNFVSRSTFERMIAGGEFLEHADVFGNWYGTHAGDTTRCLESGDDVVLVIDVQGARKVRAAGLPHVAVFVLPPSYEAIQKRLEVAREEVSAFEEYDYVVINDQLESCVERIRSIVLAERSKLQCVRPKAQDVLRTFR